MLKRAVSLAVSALLLLAATCVFAGGGKEGPAAGTKGFVSDKNLNAPGVLPICKQTVKLKIGIAKSATVLDYNTNYMTQCLKKDGNFEFTFVEMGANDKEVKQKAELQIMAGGADLPDILMYSLDDSSVAYYGQMGAFVNLNEYRKNSSHFINLAVADMQKGMGFDPFLYATSADGNLYGLFYMSTAIETAIYLRLYTNMDWLDKLGLKKPTSVSEFENMLRAFKTKDPNGNGKADEYGFVTSKDRIFNHFAMPLMTPFVYAVGQGGNNYLVFGKDGKIGAAYATEGWREGLRWLRKMTKEGLISPLSFTQDPEQLKTIANAQKESVIGCSTSYPVGWYSKGDPRAVNWACLECLTGPDGVRTAPYAPEMPTMSFFITKNCKTPEAAYRLGDLMMSEKYTLMTRFGQEDVDWVKAASTDKSYVEGYQAMYIPVLAWAIPQNKRWDNLGAWIRTPTISNGAAVRGKLSGLDAWANEMAAACLPFKDPSKLVGKIIYNAKEEEAITEVRANITTYFQECFSRFIVGDMDLDKDWDAYLNELKKMGLPTYLDAAQKAYARMHK